MWYLTLAKIENTAISVIMFCNTVKVKYYMLWWLTFLVFSVIFCRSFLSFYPFTFGHCIACPSLISGFWLPLSYILAIVLHVRLWYPASDYPFAIFWPLYCMSVFDIRLLIYPFAILWPLYCMSVFDIRLLITLLVSSNVSYIESVQMYQHEIIMIKYRTLITSKFV